MPNKHHRNTQTQIDSMALIPQNTLQGLPNELQARIVRFAVQDDNSIDLEANALSTKNGQPTVFSRLLSAIGRTTGLTRQCRCATHSKTTARQRLLEPLLACKALWQWRDAYYDINFFYVQVKGPLVHPPTGKVSFCINRSAAELKKIKNLEVRMPLTRIDQWLDLNQRPKFGREIMSGLAAATDGYPNLRSLLLTVTHDSSAPQSELLEWPAGHPVDSEAAAYSIEVRLSVIEALMALNLQRAQKSVRACFRLRQQLNDDFLHTLTPADLQPYLTRLDRVAESEIE
jgi:hypothetical protein